MTIPSMDFNWLLDQASAIAFDPARASMYVFGLGMTPEELQEQILSPMAQADLFAVGGAQFIDADKRDRYRGQLPRVGMSLFDLDGQQFGIVLSYHSKFPPDLSQYTACLAFWHQQCLQNAQG